MFLEQTCELRTFLDPHTSGSHLLSFDHTTFPFLVDFIILNLVLHAAKIQTFHSSITCKGRLVLVWCEWQEVRREGRDV